MKPEGFLSSSQGPAADTHSTAEKSSPYLQTAAERSKAFTVFARSEAVVVDSNPTEGMNVWSVYAFFCVCVVLCLGSGLATGRSLVQKILPSV
jgi:hypothetical protein